MNQVNLTMMNIFGYTFNLYAVAISVFFLAFVIGLWRAQKAQHLNWLDMLTRDGTKVSTTKVLQLLGGVVATWIVIKMTLQEKLTWDMFAIYLGYVASIDGYSKLIMAKYGAARSDDSSVAFEPGPVDTIRKPRKPLQVPQNNTQDEEVDVPLGGAKTPE